MSKHAFALAYELQWACMRQFRARTAKRERPTTGLLAEQGITARFALACELPWACMRQLPVHTAMSCPSLSISGHFRA